MKSSSAGSGLSTPSTHSSSTARYTTQVSSGFAIQATMLTNFGRRLDSMYGGWATEVPAGDAGEGGQVRDHSECSCGLGRQQSEGALIRVAATTQSLPGFDQWQKYDHGVSKDG